MTEPAYVRIADEYARRIREGELPPGVQLPSYAEIAQQNGVSDIVVRKALELLRSQGLVRSIRRRGIFVADRASLVSVSPECQMKTGERTSQRESDQDVQMERETEQDTTLGSLIREISKIQARLTEIERGHGTKLDEILALLRQDSDQ